LVVTPPLHRSTDTKRPWRSESREVALLDLRAVKLLDRSALRDWMDVAQAKGRSHGLCGGSEGYIG